MKCSKCGKEIANDSMFCEYCGKKVFMSSNKTMLWIVLAVVLSLSVTGIVIGFTESREQISPEGEVNTNSTSLTSHIDSLKELAIILDSINPTELGVLSDSVIYYKKDSSYYFINIIGQPLVKGEAFSNFTLTNNVIITELIKKDSTESRDALYEKERNRKFAKKVQQQSIYGILSLTGEELVSCKSDRIEHPSVGVHAYKIGALWGCVSDTSSILECKYRIIKYGGKENVLLCQNDSNSLYYFYDTRGKQILPNDEEKGYYSASIFSNNVALVRHFEKNAGFFTDINGKKIWSPVEAGYVDCESFKNKKAKVIKFYGGKKKYGLIDNNYYEVLPCLYDAIEEFGEKSVEVKIDGRWRVISYDQKVIADIRDYYYSDFSNCFIRSQEKDNTYSLYLNNKLFQSKLDYVYLYGYGKCAEIKKNKYYYLVNSNGKISLPYSYITSYEEGKVFKVRNENGFYGLIDSDFNVLVECKYKYLGSCMDGILVAKLDSLYGYINKKGNWILLPAYNEAKDIRDREFAIVKYENKYGIIKINQDVILPFNYDKIVPHPLFSSLYIVCKNNRYGLFDVNKKMEIVPCEFENDFKYVGNDLFPVKKNGKWGIYTRDGRSTFGMKEH